MAVRKMIECHIPAQPRTPFPASRDFPSRGNERYEGKNSESYTSCTTPAFPLWWLIDVMLFMTYDADRLIRNADFILIARKGDTTTLGLKGRQT